jgi:tryptophanyl-tRNA synthetase
MTDVKARVFSGIQPTGDIHIGNYLGAVKTWGMISETHDAIFCIVDDHAITADYDPRALPKRSFEAALAVMACGLDPEKCTLFIQSHVPEHTELTWLFNTVTPLGSLFRMHQFKDRSRASLRKALDKKGGGAKTSMLHQLKSVGTTAISLAERVAEEVDALDPEGAVEEALVSRLNENLGELMQHLQVGLGVSEALAGLFDYPVLQAADILLYKASLVPVGEDQEQHLELCREVAERFNRKFSPIFPLCKRLPGEALRILGLDGKQKMSKSLGNHIGVLDTPEVIQKKLAGAFTDPARVRKSDPGDPDKCNIFSLHGFFTDEAEREEIAAGCRSAGIGCFECKKRLAAGIDRMLIPIREKSALLRENPQTVMEALDQGGKRCRDIAKETMGEVHDAMGIGRRELTEILR